MSQPGGLLLSRPGFFVSLRPGSKNLESNGNPKAELD